MTTGDRADMAKNHVMRIGPLEGEKGRFFEYIVFPGREGRMQYFAADDDEALEAILGDYDAFDLVCEEQLAAVGARHGVSAGPLGDAGRHGLALFALDRFPGQPISALTEEMLVHHYATAARAFFESRVVDRPELDRPLRLTIDGTISFTTDLHVHRTMPDGQVVTMLMENADGIEGPVDPAALARYNRLVVVLHHRPAFILDALERAYGLEAIPVPWRVVQGVEEPTADMQLAILTTILAALSHLTPKTVRATGSLAISGFEINASIVYR